MPIFFNSPFSSRASQPPQIPSSFHVALFSQVSHRVWGDLSLRPAGPFHINMRTPLLRDQRSWLAEGSHTPKAPFLRQTDSGS